ncbi:MAG: sulfite exporter TauE/SafE family protein [Acidobacteriota bacterium]
MTGSIPLIGAVGAATGLVLGVTGAGGSVLMLPALVLLLGLGPHEAVAGSLLAVGASALAGAVSHAREGHLRLGAAAVFAAAGGLAALIGGHFGRLVPGRPLMIAFGVLMLLVAWRSLRAAPGPAPGGPAGRPVLAAWGVGVGLLSGFLGIGGGFLVVPALAGPGGLSARDAIGTALAVIAINAAAGLAGSLARLGSLPWATLLPFVAGSLAGGYLGGRLAARWPERRLRLAFALLVGAVGVVMLVRWIPAG